MAIKTKGWGKPVLPKSKPKKVRRKAPPMGPFPAESSIKSVREKATPAEERRLRGRRALEAPTMAKTVAKAERKLKRDTRRKVRRIKSERKLAESFREAVRDAPVTPPRGTRPSPKLAKVDRKAYERAYDAYLSDLSKREGLKEPDDLTNLITAATGAGALVQIGKAAVKQGAKTVTKKLADEAGEKTAKATSGGRTLTQGELRAAKARRPSRSQRNLAAHESNQAAKRASQRIRPSSRARYKQKARRYGRDKKLRYSREGRQVARRSRSVKLGANAPYIVGTGSVPLGAAGAVVAGHVNAIKDNPTGVGKRTLEIAPGLVVSTADLAAQAAVALGTGDPKGLERRISEDVGFAKELASVVASGDEKKVQSFVEKNGLIMPLLAAPPLARAGTIAKRGSTAHPTRVRETDLSQMGRGKRARVRQRHRKRLSRDAARARSRAEAESAAAGVPVVRAYTGSRGKKGVKDRRKARDKAVDPGDVMALAAEEGLRPGPKIAENFEAVARKWGGRPVFGDKRQGGVTGHELIAYVRSNPRIWEDKAFWRTVEAYRAQEPARRLSERVVDIEQAKTHGVRLAEDRPTPTARRAIPGVESREAAVAYLSKAGEGGKRVRGLRAQIRAAEGKARELRAELRQLEKQDRTRQRRAAKPTKSQRRELAALRAMERRGMVAPQPHRGLEVAKSKQVAPMAVTRRRQQQLLDQEANLRGLRAELAETQKRHKSVTSSLRDPAEAAAVKREFDAELEGVRRERDLARGAFVPHTDVGREGIPVAQPVTRAAKKIHKREAGEASLAERGRVDYSLGTILQAGIEAPIIRQELHTFTDQAVREGAIPFRDAKTGKVKRIGTREQFERGLTPEQKEQGVLFPLSQFKQAIKEDDVVSLERIVEGLGSEVAAVEGKPGQKYAFLDRDYGLELKAQMSAPGSALRKAQTLSRGISRTILTSPAWAAGQVLAETFQAAHAINPLNPLNIHHFYQGYVKGQREMGPAKRTEFRAEAGALPGMGLGPREFATVSGQVQRGLADNFRRYERVLPIKRLIQTVRGDWIKAVDRMKGGELRVMVAATKAHKDAMGFGKKLERLVTKQRQTSEMLAKMSPAERLEWMMRDTPARRELTEYLDDTLGNWTAFSRKEAAFAPALIFYNFFRMSMQWPFYTFPKRHPARASVMYALASSHNNQIRKLLGGPPSWFGEYATAIVYGKRFRGGAQLTKASRIIPGAGPVMEGLAAGVDVTAQRALNPIAGYFNALFNGIDPLSGEKVDPEHLSAEEALIARAGLTVSLLFNTFPPARAADQAKGAKEKTALPLIGERYEESALGDLLEELRGSPGKQALQTIFNPIPTVDLDKARDRAVMGRIFEIWRTDGSDAQAAVKEDKGLNVREKERKIKAMKKRSDEASSELKRLYRKYDIEYEKEEKQALAEWSRLTYGKKEKKGGGNAYLEALDTGESKGNAYLDALEDSSSKGKNPYLEALE